MKFDGRRQKTLSLTAFSFKKTKNKNLEEWEGGGEGGAGGLPARYGFALLICRLQINDNRHLEKKRQLWK